MKIKTFWKGLLIALAVIITAGLFANFFIKQMPDVQPKTYDYKISYIRADTGEDILTQYRFMMKKSGVYPLGYNKNSATFTISDLYGKLKPVPEEWGMPGMYTGQEVSDPNDKGRSYAFFGWYLDVDCTIEFEGTVHEGAAEDIVLYADITESVWTGNY